VSGATHGGTKTNVRTSVVIVAYQSGPALTRCLHSIEPDIDGQAEVIVVDNGDGGPEVGEAERMNFVRVISAGKNLGFAAGCNLGARHAVGTSLIFLNPDTVIAPGALERLVATLEDPTIGIAMARLRLLDRPELLNSSGSEVHVSGISWAGGYGEPADSVAELREVPAPSGAAMAIRADTFRVLGGFTDALFMYQEDLMLGWKARLAGLRVVIEPGADVYHDYEYGRNVAKHYLLERNRLVFVLSSYSARLLLLLSPVLLSTELAMTTLAAREGWFRDKLRGWAWCARNARWLAHERRETQRLRRVSDRELAPLLSATLTPAMISVPAAAKAANRLVEAYWRLARRAL
jgi:GT2 family glycosyltransferase